MGLEGWRSYVRFTRQERWATILLVGLTLAAWMVPFLLPEHPLPPRIRPWPGEVDSSGSADPVRAVRREGQAATARPVAGFPFDPNTLDAAGWRALGLDDRKVRTLLNYRSKGGRFRKPEDLIRLWLDANEDLSSEADSVRHELDAAYNRLREQLEKADPTLGPSVQAERQKALNGIDNLMKKGAAALKRRHEVVLSQVRSIVEMVNPDEEPQERLLNLFQFYPVIGPTLLEVLKTQLQPFDKDLQVIVY